MKTVVINGKNINSKIYDTNMTFRCVTYHNSAYSQWTML